MSDIRKIPTYSLPEIRALIGQMLVIYDLVRLVDPKECRELVFDGEGNIAPTKKCFHVWSNDNRCANCSSFRACESRKRAEKIEYFNNNTYHILSMPIRLDTPDGEISCIMECITIREGVADDHKDSQGVKAKDDKLLVDSLTGLYNHDGFYEEARNLLSAHPNDNYSLIIYNLPRFKMINDVFSREKGNEILVRMGELINSHLKENDICARLRADRFALLIHTDNINDELLIKELDEENLLNSTLYHLNVQLGIYEINNPDLPISAMIDRANIALSTISDNTIANKVYFDEKMLDKLKMEQDIINRCKQAISDQEFVFYLQPQVLKDGTIIGAEALARWLRPDGTLNNPAGFIPVLEKSELIVSLDTYIWRLAAAKLAEWKDTPMKDLYISVNISPRDFFYIDLLSFFEDLIKEYGIDKRKLKLEITESVMMDDASRQLSVIDDLHAAGFEIEIDDFGKGYSSLSLLKDISADTIKIDREFLKECVNDRKAERILTSIIRMAQELKLNLIIEGVENETQFARMADLGCENFQGFYFSKPLKIADFESVFINTKGKIGA